MADKFKLNAKAIIIAATLSLAAFAAVVATPRLHEIENPPELEKIIPRQFGEWKELPNPLLQVGLTTGTEAEPDINQPYDQTVMRSYRDQQGHQIHLAVAWGKRQRQEVKIHRPELCYPAQGYGVSMLQDATFPVQAMSDGQQIIGKRMIATDRGGGIEAVSYWIRIGKIYTESALQTRFHIFQEGMAGVIPDGVLVRVSQRVPKGVDLEPVFERQERFMSDIVAATPVAARELMAR